MTNTFILFLCDMGISLFITTLGVSIYTLYRYGPENVKKVPDSIMVPLGMFMVATTTVVIGAAISVFLKYFSII